jgi:hypothetical protein
LPRLGLELVLTGVFLYRGLRVASSISDLIQTCVSVVAALMLRPSTIAHALNVEGISELQQPVLRLRQPPKIIRRWPLETLGRFEGC